MSVNCSFIFSRSPYLPVKVFIKVTKELVKNLEGDKRSLCTWLLYYVTSFRKGLPSIRVPCPKFQTAVHDHFNGGLFESVLTILKYQTAQWLLNSCHPKP